jgi:hypothetical protein
VDIAHDVPMPNATFKERSLVLGEIDRELALLRSHNAKFKKGDAQRDMLMFAEAALTSLRMEHFLRVLLGAKATGTLYNLLQLVVQEGLKLDVKNVDDEGIKEIVNVRNTLLHGNYVQAAAAENVTVAEYFSSGKFGSNIRHMREITDHMVRQVDPETGEIKVT